VLAFERSRGMNLLIKLRPNTNIEWFDERLRCVYPPLKDCGIIYEVAADGKHIRVIASVNDEEAHSFTGEVILISPQVVSVQRA